MYSYSNYTGFVLNGDYYRQNSPKRDHPIWISTKDGAKKIAKIRNIPENVYKCNVSDMFVIDLGKRSNQELLIKDLQKVYETLKYDDFKILVKYYANFSHSVSRDIVANDWDLMSMFSKAIRRICKNETPYIELLPTINPIKEIDILSLEKRKHKYSEQVNSIYIKDHIKQYRDLDCRFCAAITNGYLHLGDSSIYITSDTRTEGVAFLTYSDDVLKRYILLPGNHLCSYYGTRVFEDKLSIIPGVNRQRRIIYNKAKELSGENEHYLLTSVNNTLFHYHIHLIIILDKPKFEQSEEPIHVRAKRFIKNGVTVTEPVEVILPECKHTYINPIDHEAYTSSILPVSNKIVPVKLLDTPPEEKFEVGRVLSDYYILMIGLEIIHLFDDQIFGYIIDSDDKLSVLDIGLVSSSMDKISFIAPIKAGVDLSCDRRQFKTDTKFTVIPRNIDNARLIPDSREAYRPIDINEYCNDNYIRIAKFFIREKKYNGLLFAMDKHYAKMYSDYCKYKRPVIAPMFITISPKLLSIDKYPFQLEDQLISSNRLRYLYRDIKSQYSDSKVYPGSTYGFGSYLTDKQIPSDGYHRYVTAPNGRSGLQRTARLYGSYDQDEHEIIKLVTSSPKNYQIENNMNEFHRYFHNAYWSYDLESFFCAVLSSKIEYSEYFVYKDLDNICWDEMYSRLEKPMKLKFDYFRLTTFNYKNSYIYDYVHYIITIINQVIMKYRIDNFLQ